MNEELTPTFEREDKLELRDFAQRLEEFMATEIRFIENGALVISLNGSFGSGKTTFLNMWRNDLVRRRKAEAPLPIPILLNAWESDFSNDPLLALVSAISTALGESAQTKKESHVREMRDAVKDVANFTVALAGSFTKSVTGLDALAAGKYAEEKKTARDKKPPHLDLLAVYEARQSALTHLKGVLNSAFGGSETRALIMVDELDRCRPSYAIDYLEAIKHVFDIEGLVFVLAVDKSQLEASAKALFGESLNFTEYYRKFAHRNVSLPSPSAEGLARLVEHFTRTILVADTELKRASMLKINERIKDISDAITTFDLLPRQIREMFRLMGHVLACRAEQSGNLLWCFGGGAILMAALSMRREQLYHRIGRGQAKVGELKELLALFEPHKREWWATLIVTGYKSDESKDWESVIGEFITAGILSEKYRDKNNRHGLGQFSLGWGDHESGLRYIYKNIETLKRFASP